MSRIITNPTEHANIVVGVAPCADCSRRHVGCHSRCADYLQWSDKRLAEKEKHYFAYLTEVRAKRKGIAKAIIATTRHGKHQYRRLKYADALLKR